MMRHKESILLQYEINDKGDKMKDYMIRGMDKIGRLRMFAASTTGMVEEFRKIHESSPTATAAAGRAMTAAVMMAAGMKNENDKLTLKISGGGPLGSIIVVANSRGQIKALVDNPLADTPSTSDNKLDVGSLVGNDGTVTVIMDHGLKEPYVGQTSLVTGEIGDDIANFYMVSEQFPTAVALGILVDRDISCRAAGGYMIQVLPFITDDEITEIEDAIKNADPISAMIDKGMTPEEIMQSILPGFDMEVTDSIDLEYRCDCSMSKIRDVMVSLGEKEIEDIIEEDGESEIICHFCNTKYRFDRDELEKILLTIRGE